MRVGTETAHARFFHFVDLAQLSALRSIIRNASIDCAEIFARNLECAGRPAGRREQLVLTLRNRERYKGFSGAPLGAPSDFPFDFLKPFPHCIP